MAGKAKAFIRVDLSDKDAVAKLRKLQKEFQEAGGKIKTSFGDKIAKLGLQMQALDIGIKWAQRLGGAILDVSRDIDFAAKSSRQLGLQSTADFIALKHGADQAGVGMEQLRMALVQMQKQGLRIEDVADEIQSIEDPTKRVQRAMELLGTEAGPRVLTLLEGGSEGIRRFREEADELGITVSDQVAGKFEHLNDTLDRMQKAAKGARVQLAAAFADDIIVLVKSVGVFVNDLGLRLNIMWKTARLVFVSIPLAVAEMWNATLHYTEVGTNQLLSLFDGLAKALPETVRKFMGFESGAPRVDFSGLQIDTTVLKQAMTNAELDLRQAVGETPVLARLLNMPAPGDTDDGGDNNGDKDKAEALKRAQRMAKNQLDGYLKGTSAAASEYRDRIEEAQREIDLLISFDEAARDEEDRRRGLGFAGRLREDFGKALGVIDEQKQVMRGKLADLATEGVNMFANMGQGIASAFQAAFSGGDFGAALQQIIGQQLVTLGSQLIQAGAYTLAMAALASIPFIGNAFGGPPAAAAAFALAPLAIAAGTGLVAAGSAMGASGAEVQARAQARSGRRTPSAGPGGSAPVVRTAAPRMGPDFGNMGGSGGAQVVNINFSGVAVDRRRVSRDVRDALEGRA
jgi:hypothetical protein